MPRPPNIDAQIAKLEARYAREKKRLVQKKSRPLMQRYKQLKAELSRVEREMSRLGLDDGRRSGAPRVGRPPAEAGAAPVRRRRRLGREAKMALAEKIYNEMKSSKGQCYRAGELNKLADGIPVPQLIGLWNKANKQTPIASEGKLSKMRYFVD